MRKIRSLINSFSFFLGMCIVGICELMYASYRAFFIWDAPWMAAICALSASAVFIIACIGVCWWVRKQLRRPRIGRAGYTEGEGPSGERL